MFCGKCSQEREDKDFFKGQEYCYKCMYKIKTNINLGKRGRKKYCRICKKELAFDCNAKKRQRNVFCSLACAEIGQKDMRITHWTKKVRKYQSGVSHICFGSCYEET